jgi:hypothetical protein
MPAESGVLLSVYYFFVPRSTIRLHHSFFLTSFTTLAQLTFSHFTSRTTKHSLLETDIDIYFTMGFSNSHHPDTPPLAIEGSRKRKQHIHEISSDENDNDNDQPKRPLLSNKRVKFAFDRTTECPSTIVHEDLDKQALWWRRQERLVIQQNCRETYQRFRNHHMDQVRRYLQVVRQCQMAPTNESSEYLNEITLIVPDRIRGLEWGVMPSSKECRSAHVQNVLDVQAELDEQQGMNAMTKSRVLGTNSIRSSRPSRVLARLLGEGDAAKLQESTRTSKPKSSLAAPLKPTHHSNTAAPPSRPRMWCRMSDP